MRVKSKITKKSSGSRSVSKTKTSLKKRTSNANCRPTFKISQAGHLLKVSGDSQAASVLSREGKSQKAKRKKKGCLNGTKGTFKLTEKQKRKLPKNLQKAILEYHRKKGKKIA
jgi:hypothetical protein